MNQMPEGLHMMEHMMELQVNASQQQTETPSLSPICTICGDIYKEQKWPKSG